MSSLALSPNPSLIAIALVVRSRAGPKFVYHYPPSPSIANSSARRDSDTRTTAKNTDSSASVDEEGSSSEDEEETESLGSRRGGGGSGGRDGKQVALGGALRFYPDKDRDKDRDRDRDRDGRRASSRLNNIGEHAAPPKKSSSVPDMDVNAKESSAEERMRGGDDSCGFQWDSFLGLECSVWEKLLSPSPSWHKRRFEVGVNDLTFVGWPVFVKKDGSWGRRKRNKGDKTDKPSSKRRAGAGAGKGGESETEPETDVEDNDDDYDDEEEEEEEGEEEEEATTPSVVVVQPEVGAPTAVEDDSQNTKDAMTMFNVVFVLNPEILEYGDRVRECYENVIKKFGKALKLEQARADYVWRETQTILNIKDKCREIGECYSISLNPMSCGILVDSL